MSDVVDRAWEILSKHVGHRHPITSAELSRMLEVGDDKRGTRATREIVRDVLRRGLPVAATEEGYFVAENEQEHDGYINELNDRIVGIQSRGQLFERAFRSYRQQSNQVETTPIRWAPEPEEIP